MSEDKKTSMWAGRPVEELLYYLAQQGTPDSRAHQEVKGAVAHALASMLCESIDRHERAATRLSKQIFWLNIILGIFTIAGTILAVVSLAQ